VFLTKATAFIKRDFLTEISYKSTFLMNLIGIFFSVLTFFFIAKLFGQAAAPHLQEYGGDYFPFVLIGIAFSTFLGVGLGTSATALRQEQMLGTLEAMLITPTRASSIVIFLVQYSCLSFYREVRLRCHIQRFPPCTDLDRAISFCTLFQQSGHYIFLLCDGF
jgi:ABC-2 type transport system permease protein